MAYQLHNGRFILNHPNTVAASSQMSTTANFGSLGSLGPLLTHTSQQPTSLVQSGHAPPLMMHSLGIPPQHRSQLSLAPAPLTSILTVGSSAPPPHIQGGRRESSQDPKQKPRILEKLKQLKDSGKYCDVVIDVKGRRFRAHKNVLASWSPFFDMHLFADGYTRQDLMIVGYDNHEVFSDLLDFLYSGCIAPRETNFMQLLHLAVSFQIDLLRSDCEEYLRSNLHLGNFLRTFFLSLKYKLTSLEEFVLEYLQKNLSDAVKQNEFLSLSVSSFHAFLSNGKMETVKPEIKLFLIISWVGFEVVGREKYLVVLLKHIDWSTVASDFLLEISRTENFFTSHESSLYLLLQTLYSSNISLGPYVELFPSLRQAYSYLLNDVLYVEIPVVPMPEIEDYVPVVVTVCPSPTMPSILCCEVAVNTDVTGPDVEAAMPADDEQSLLEFQHTDLPREIEMDFIQSQVAQEMENNTDQFYDIGDKETNDQIDNKENEEKEEEEDKTEDEEEEEEDEEEEEEETEKEEEEEEESEDDEPRMYISDAKTYIEAPKASVLSSSTNDQVRMTRNKKVTTYSTPPEKVQESSRVKIKTSQVKTINETPVKRISARQKKKTAVSNDVILVEELGDDEDTEYFPDKSDSESGKHTQRGIQKVSLRSKRTSSLLLRKGHLSAPANLKKKTSYRRVMKHCKKCPFTANNFTEMREHTKKSHPKNHYETQICDLCGFTGAGKGFYDHMRAHFPGAPPFVCVIEGCKYETKKIHHMLIHMKHHTGKRDYPCSKCDMAFRSKNNLAQHMKTHTGVKPFSCKICSKSFATKHTLFQHTATHTDVREFLCETCGFSTKYQSHLKAHKRIHTGDVFYCEQEGCKYFTPKQCQLKTHMKFHLGVRNYRCDICDKSFYEKNHLSRHNLIHSDVEPFKCSFEECKYTSKRSDKLKEHYRKHHGENATAKMAYKPRKKKTDKIKTPKAANAHTQFDHAYTRRSPSEELLYGPFSRRSGSPSQEMIYIPAGTPIIPTSLNQITVANLALPMAAPETSTPQVMNNTIMQDHIAFVNQTRDDTTIMITNPNSQYTYVSRQENASAETPSKMVSILDGQGDSRPYNHESDHAYIQNRQQPAEHSLVQLPAMTNSLVPAQSSTGDQMQAQVTQPQEFTGLNAFMALF